MANGVLTLVAALTVAGGCTTLIGMAIMTRSDFGELAEFRIQLITGVVIGVITSTIKLLSLFGALHAPPRRPPPDAPHETAAPANGPSLANLPNSAEAPGSQALRPVASMRVRQ